MFTHPEYDGHEAVLHAHDPLTGLKAIVALHNTRLGPAFGGCRMYPYADPAQALTDALRLSRGMTYKAAICELPYGGGKSVVLADPRRDKTPELLRAMGRVIEGQGGRYITADDVGTTLADLAVMREVTRHTAGATAAAQEPLAVTAYGVLMAIEAAVRHYYQRPDLEGLHFAVQGLGNVGYPLCEHLRGARGQADGERRRPGAHGEGGIASCRPRWLAPRRSTTSRSTCSRPAPWVRCSTTGPSRTCGCGWSAAVRTTSWRTTSTTPCSPPAASPTCRTTWPTPAA